MPVSELGQGWGKYTSEKNKAFQYILSTHMEISKRCINKHGHWAGDRYVYIDLNAGCGGQGELNESMGSAQRFMRTALELQQPSWGNFMDINPEALKALCLISQDVDDPEQVHTFLPGDNREQLPLIEQHIGTAVLGERPYGLVYSDENGSQPPFEALQKFYRKKAHGQLDLLIYLSCTNIKRCLKSPSCVEARRLTDLIELVPKKYWQIKEPAGKHQWTFLFGANWLELPTFKRLGFHPLESEAGQDILLRVAYTKQEIAEMNNKQEAAV